MTRFALICDPRATALTMAETSDPLTAAAGRPQIARAGKRAPVNAWHSPVRTERLVAAAGGLGDGIRLCLGEAYRPAESPQASFDDDGRELQARSGREEAATKYVAWPDRAPPHSAGPAADVTPLPDNVRELDMGSTPGDTPPSNENRNFTHSRRVTTAARCRRVMLVNAMTQVGFENYPAEWWHWSYGDQHWAYRRRRRTSFHGSVSASDIPCRRSPA
jgi:zinc D-Ala-D-Ala dipeptidase